MTNPVAIVTGGRQGIGLATSQALANDGFEIVVADLGHDAEHTRADIEARGAGFAYCPCDIADLSAHARLVETALAKFGRIDCLVNNAGIGAPMRCDLLDLAPENFDRVLGVNLRGTVFLSQVVAKAMLAGAGDAPRSIITVTSVSAEMASPDRSDYCVSKAGLSMWMKAMALRLAGENIGVFEVRPGIIRTAMTAGVSARYDARIEEGLVPANRWGEPGDVGRAIAALASGRFAFATGSVISVDGALSVPRL